MIRGWQAYLQGANNPKTYGRCISESRPGFAVLRDLIARLIEKLEPREVVCLGAGALNDIPFRRLLRRGCRLQLVDWLPDIIEAGVQGSSMSEDATGQSACVFCELGEEGARDFCQAFDRRRDDQPGVCENYQRMEEAYLACKNYQKGSLPAIYQEDITGGFASAFAEEATRDIATSGSWRGALKQALKIARNPNPPKPLSVKSATADLVISSMVLSQFEFEPYQYFASRAIAAHGQPTGSLARKLDDGVNRLRDILLSESVGRHCREITRMLKPDGRCFMAFEMYHQSGEADGWFIVRQMHETVPVLQKHFRFDFEQLQAPDHVVELADGNSSSLVYCYLLQPRAEGECA